MSDRTLLLLGASGLVGGHVLQHVTHDPFWDRVVTLSRRALPLVSERHEDYVVDFQNLDAHADLFSCDAVACCLGTTIKQAGSQEAFRFVDHDLPLTAARQAVARGASAYTLVSAYGANADSRIFYNRTKGDTEEALRDIGFDRLVLLRPSLLTGDREENRPGERFGEAFLNAIQFTLIGPLRNLKPTPADDVAIVMAAALRSAVASGDGAAAPVEVIEPVEIRTRAAELRDARGA